MKHVSVDNFIGITKIHIKMIEQVKGNTFNNNIKKECEHLIKELKDQIMIAKCIYN